MPKPKPASTSSNESNGNTTTANADDGGPTGADAHRQQQEEEEAEVPPMPDSPGDRGGGGGGGGGDTPSAGAGGTLSSISIPTKTLIGVAALGIGAYLAYRYFVSQGTGKTLVEGIDEDTDLENPDVDPDGGGIEQEEDPTPDIPNDPQDPLKADHEAGKHVFGWGDN